MRAEVPLAISPRLTSSGRELAAAARSQLIDSNPVAAGLDPDRFWRLTPREIAREVAALQRRERRAYAQAMSVAWHAAAFQRAKRPPSLTTVLRQIEDAAARARRPRTPEEEQQAVVARQMAAFASLRYGS